MARLHDEKCALVLERMVFDKISFSRKGFKSTKDPIFSFQVSTGKKSDEEIFKVSLELSVEKEKEYDIVICLSGFFSVNLSQCDGVDPEDLIGSNAVAILLPYVRSELSLLTAQPEMDCIVLPPINICAMMEQGNEVE